MLSVAGAPWGSSWHRAVFVRPAARPRPALPRGPLSLWPGGHLCLAIRFCFACCVQQRVCFRSGARRGRIFFRVSPPRSPLPLRCEDRRRFSVEQPAVDFASPDGRVTRAPAVTRSPALGRRVSSLPAPPRLPQRCCPASAAGRRPAFPRLNPRSVLFLSRTKGGPQIAYERSFRWKLAHFRYLCQVLQW